MRRRLGAVTLAGLVAAVPALLVALAGGARPPASPAAAPPPAPDPALVRKGRALFQDICARCHGPQAGGTTRGPSLKGVGAAGVNQMLATGRMPLGDGHAGRGEATLSKLEIAAVVAYYESLNLGGPDVPTATEVQPSRGDLPEGRALFTANCAGCHGPGGRGIVVGENATAPDLSRASATEVAGAVRSGPFVMPKFSEEQISDTQLNSLVRYVLDLHEPPSPGGVGLHFMGPFFEGLVAWVVGMVVLLVVIRVAGSRT